MSWYTTDNVDFYLKPAGAKNHDVILPGAYTINSGMTGIYVTKKELKKEELLEFPNSPQQVVINEIENFWNMEPKYVKLGLPYRRGFLLHGDPGTGKSGAIKIICNKIISRKGIVAIIEDSSDISRWIEVLNNTNIRPVFVMEDLDQIVDHGEHSLLQLLDGITDNIHGSIFVASTNYIDEIPNRVKRPSRFDQIIEIPAPSDAMRKTYIKELYKRFNTKYNAKVAEKTKGMTFAHIKEVVIATLLYEKSINDVIDRLKGVKEDDD